MDQFINLFAEALEREEAMDLNDEFRNYEEWDSLAVLSIIAMIKQNYDITIPRQEFEALRTISDLYNHIQSKN